MTDKELKRLSRADLLKLLLIQTREVERLRKELKEAEAKLKEQKLQGSMADAMTLVNGMMDAARDAAERYLEEMAAMEAAKDSAESYPETMDAAQAESRHRWELTLYDEAQEDQDFYGEDFFTGELQ